jgi:hypothetical protein
MALTEKDYAELEQALASGELDPAIAEQAKATLAKRGATVSAAPKNSLGVTGIIQPGGEPEVSPQDSEMGRIASALDPRFDLIPQSLALLPATNHPHGDEAAIASYKAGTAGDVKFAYEPPVAVVRKQLLENPAMLGLLRSDPPSPEEIATMDEDHPVYQDAANYMWARLSEDAAKKGYTVYRYSRMPWGKENDAAGGLEALGLKLHGAMQPIRDAEQALILGVDNMGAFGASRAIDESLGPRPMGVPSNVDVMGMNEQAEQDPAFLNQSLIEEHPLAYGGGQVIGAVEGAPQAIYKGILAGGSKLAQLVARTRLGALATKAPELVKSAAAVAGEVGTGTAEAMGTQAGREMVDRATPGREPVLGAGERIMDTGQDAALWGFGGSVLGRLAGAGANAIRNSDSLGGAIGRTESNLRYGPLSPLLGPSLSGDAKDLIRLGNKTRTEPGDFIAEQIAPPIRKAAEARTRAAEGAQQAERANYHQSELGREALPVTGLQTMSLEKLRAHHQPLPEGGLHAVDDKHRDAQKVFNRLTKDVSLEPVEGAAKLTPDEAGAFLSVGQRRKLLVDDIEAAAERRRATPEDRKAYLGTVDPKKRAAVDEEIQASIDDLLQERGGDRALDADQRRAAYKDAEQQVLRERVDEDMVLEPFDGSFAGYLKQRGVDGVYVTPHAYDAKRTDTLIEGIADKDLRKAAEHDRAQRVHGGERGGYAKMHERHAEEIGKAKAVEESIAPKGDAFRAVARQGNRPQAGDKAEADVISGLAKDAGVSDDLGRLRGFQDARDIQRQAWFRSPKGSPRGVGVHSLADAAKIRAFPILRALEPGGEVTGGMMSRMALMGQIEDEKARAAEVDRKKPAYEQRRSKLQKQKDAEREKERKERERRATEKHRDE